MVRLEGAGHFGSEVREKVNSNACKIGAYSKILV